MGVDPTTKKNKQTKNTKKYTLAGAEQHMYTRLFASRSLRNGKIHWTNLVRPTTDEQTKTKEIQTLIGAEQPM